MSWVDRLFGGGAAKAPPAAVVEQRISISEEPDFVVIDVETACSAVSSICQIGVVGFAGEREVLTWEALVDPRRAFDSFNTRLHGIGPEHVRGKPHFAEVYGDVAALLNGRITVAHSGFDRGALRAACGDHRLEEVQARWLDSVGVARLAWPDFPNHKLNTLARRLSIPLDHHDALSDARAAGRVMLRAMEATGFGLEDWFCTRRRAALRAGPDENGDYVEPNLSRARKPAGDGPLSGEVVVLTGGMTMARGPLADTIAAAGGRVMTSVGAKTTLLVCGDDAGSPSAKSRKAAELIASGQAIRRVSEAELLAMLAGSAADIDAVQG